MGKFVLGSDQFGFPARFSPPVTLQITTQARSTFYLAVFARKFNSSWRIIGYNNIEQRHCEPQKLAMFEYCLMY